MKKVVPIILLVSLIFCESELLRSKYLTQDMMNNIKKLDQYDKTARVIFNKYEKAKFYQIVAFTYYLKYQDLIEELNSLERQYISIINNYNPGFDISEFNQISAPKMENTFSPILFSENSNIKIRLFKTKAGLFEKQYHEYLEYFNNKVNIFKNMLQKAKVSQKKTNDISSNKNFKDYSDFILNIESEYRGRANINTIIEGQLLREINWYEDGIYCKKEFFYSEELNLYKTIDYKNNLKEHKTIYDIDDDFINYIINNKFIRNISGHGNYSISFFNKFSKIYKTVYYSVNGEIIGSIHFNFKENLELLSEIWYIGDNRKKIKELSQVYDPKTHKYITIEDRVIKELR